MAVAEFLAQDRRVSRVYYPGPAVASRSRDREAADDRASAAWSASISTAVTIARSACYDRLRVIKRAASLGGVESLISMPVLTSQWGHTDEQLREAGVTKGHAAAVGRVSRTPPI